MFYLRCSLLLILTVSLASLAGCGGAPTKGTVNGTVSWNNQPLPEGIVNFLPADGKSQTGSAAIKDGKFTVELPITTMKVQFSAPKIVGKKKMYDTDDSPWVDTVEELLPEKYNVKTEISLTVKGGVQDEKFDLKK
jgi:hypothetical protein